MLTSAPPRCGAQVVRNKMHRTREMRKMKAAKAWLAEQPAGKRPSVVLQWNVVLQRRTECNTRVNWPHT